MEVIRNVRKLHRELRDQMTQEEVTEKSIKICEMFLQSDWYEKESVIYLFYPLGNEVSLVHFMKQALKDGKTLAFPRVKGDKMEFFKVTDLSQLEEGYFHVMEPIASCPRLTPGKAQANNANLEEQLPVVLVPGLVFDEKGNRYGYGKGFYDRYFSRYQSIQKRYAIAFEHQMEHKIEVQTTDVPVTRIYTESCIRIIEE